MTRHFCRSSDCVAYRQAGFTLLELLVAMTLLSVIMAGLVSALRTMAQTESKIDQRLLRLDETRIARAFLQQTLARVSSAKVDALDATGQKVVQFNVTQDSVTWIGIMPARPNVGGRHFFRLAIEDTPAGRELVIRFIKWTSAAVQPDWALAESRVLAQGVEEFKVQAQGDAPTGRGAGGNAGAAWPLGWQAGWPVADVLPERLRLQMSDARGEWPEWTIALNALPQSDGSFNLVVVGGGGKN